MIKLCDDNSCTQCFACYLSCPRHCISMETNAEGFKSPKIDYANCIDCQQCVKSCHVLSPLHDGVQEDAYPKVYAAWSKDNVVRTQSSSGGLFSVIAKFILSRHGVVYGAAFSEKLRLIHQRIETVDELESLRESKYLISELGDTFKAVKDDLRTGEIVFFIGTPCQVAGLKKYLKKDYDNLFTCDILCHGVPSYKSFLTYLQSIFTDVEIAEIVNFHFRYVKGWGYQLSADFEKKKCIIPPPNDFYLRAFNIGLMSMEACFKCKYSNPKRVGDITLGDFWDIGRKIPFKHKKRKGVSLLLVNNCKGNFIFEEICEQVSYELRTLQEAMDGNHNLHSPSVRPKGRDTYVYDSFIKDKKELISKYGLAPSIKDYLRPIKRRIIG